MSAIPQQEIQTRSLHIPLRPTVSRFLPGPLLRFARRLVRPTRVSATEYQLRYEFNQLQGFERVLNRHQLSWGRFDSIFEFACGWGRLTRYLHELAPVSQIFGCDIDEKFLADCRRQCPWGHFLTTQTMPPLDFDDGQFDLIWSYSVFTSLSETCHRAWLGELARKLRPGGVMLHTTHSFEYLRRAVFFTPDVLRKYNLPEPVDEFIQSSQGYYYVPYSSDTPDYGLAIISQDYVTAMWPEYTGLHLLDYVAGAIESYPEGCMDMVLMRKEL